MNTRSKRIAAVAHLMAAFALLQAPNHARAANDVTDRHEIPPFVLDRIEFVARTGRVDCQSWILPRSTQQGDGPLCEGRTDA